MLAPDRTTDKSVSVQYPWASVLESPSEFLLVLPSRYSPQELSENCVEYGLRQGVDMSWVGSSTRIFLLSGRRVFRRRRPDR